MKAFGPRKSWMAMVIIAAGLIANATVAMAQAQSAADGAGGGTGGTHGEWTWMGGANVPGQKGIYGSLGKTAPGNIPGGRGCAVAWTDKSGNFWLFGGEGMDSSGKYGWLNDLWKYSGGEWTWMAGSKLNGQKGSYGTKGAAGAGNTPGARGYSTAWTDAAGNLWLFGGYGIDSAGRAFMLNDLWEYSAGKWIWMSGSNLIDQDGNYGTEGTPAPDNVPPPRENAVGWADAAGNIWLYGGDSPWVNGSFGDLWRFSAGQWTWMGGSNTVNSTPAYGTMGVADAGNDPGERVSSARWIDAAGNFWILGGNGFNIPGGTDNYLSDLWEYSGGVWTWIGGLNTNNQPGSYGSKGVGAAGNTPGARESALSLSDAAGNFWLFGGVGYDSRGTEGELNDLWKYSSGQWTWMGGSNVNGAKAMYGTKGMAAAGNSPAARSNTVGWVDASGNVWIFGGIGTDAAGNSMYFNDLWKFTP
jgi:hypothetical protein